MKIFMYFFILGVSLIYVLISIYIECRLHTTNDTLNLFFKILKRIFLDKNTFKEFFFSKKINSSQKLLNSILNDIININNTDILNFLSAQQTLKGKDYNFELKEFKKLLEEYKRGIEKQSNYNNINLENISKITKTEIGKGNFQNIKNFTLGNNKSNSIQGVGYEQ